MERSLIDYKTNKKLLFSATYTLSKFICEKPQETYRPGGDEQTAAGKRVKTTDSKNQGTKEVPTNDITESISYKKLYSIPEAATSS